MYQKIKLLSKRNDVYRIIDGDKKYISKTFMNISDMRKEEDFLILLKNQNINVPNIISKENNTLELEDLGDLTLLDWYEQIEVDNSCDYKNIIIKLCMWLKKFYDVTFNYYKKRIIISDVNFRNFIIKNGEIYGIDFEQSCEGKIESDLGKLVAYALTYNPIMTEWKLRFADELINMLEIELKVNKKLIIEEKEKELKKIIERRKQ
ncbi:hypothetical protein J2Z76_001675 [Sedimentibacter acidaminivorans]|uniref:non-specific serine/threonine protein kinase n=1 Tax=Sedimentibacter acidaminivorans TaxID=913099 RepID=A0ABS4GDQ0_9FIRM|nr:RIO1 family regulatory kinase/ATPase [Sedimentibacter acidaminivorans]MBP1925814.1 hypothetical protein [Sedimentibacter acidaminivorans]